jgi:hypothetical protein
MTTDHTRIADELAINNLVNRYSDAIVRRAADDWGNTWSIKGEWHLFGQVHQGRDVIVQQWEGLLGRLPFVHQQSSGGLITFPNAADTDTDTDTDNDNDTGINNNNNINDTATGRWYVTEWGVTGDGPGMLTLGVYHDDYVREPAADASAEATCWRFARRKFAPLYMGPPDLSGAPKPFPTDA